MNRGQWVPANLAKEHDKVLDGLWLLRWLESEEFQVSLEVMILLQELRQRGERERQRSTGTRKRMHMYAPYYLPFYLIARGLWAATYGSIQMCPGKTHHPRGSVMRCDHHTLTYLILVRCRVPFDQVLQLWQVMRELVSVASRHFATEVDHVGASYRLYLIQLPISPDRRRRRPSDVTRLPNSLQESCSPKISGRNCQHNEPSLSKFYL